MGWDPPRWEPEPASALTVAQAPDPAETLWTLGTGAAAWDGRIRAGFDLGIASVLRDAGVALSYSGSDVLDAAIWRGSGAPAVATPDVAWISAAAGTFTLALAGVASAGLDPGSYRLRVGVTAAGVRYVAFDGTVEVVESPGSTTLRAPYIKVADLAGFYGQVGTLQNAATGDATFLRERARTSDDFDRRLVTRYDPYRGLVRVRRATPDPVLGGFDVPDPTATPPTPRAISDALKAGGLVIDEGAREILCRMALARILEQVQVMGGGRNPYLEEADRFRREAEDLWKTRDIQVDLDGDGTADVLVGREAILLPAGTAP